MAPPDEWAFDGLGDPRRGCSEPLWWTLAQQRRASGYTLTVPAGTPGVSIDALKSSFSAATPYAPLNATLLGYKVYLSLLSQCNKRQLIERLQFPTLTVPQEVHRHCK